MLNILLVEGDDIFLRLRYEVDVIIILYPFYLDVEHICKSMYLYRILLATTQGIIRTSMYIHTSQGSIVATESLHLMYAYYIMLSCSKAWDGEKFKLFLKNETAVYREYTSNTFIVMIFCIHFTIHALALVLYTSKIPKKKKKKLTSTYVRTISRLVICTNFPIVS